MDIILVILLGLLVWFLATGIIVVKQKTAVVIELFGKFYTIKEAGLRLKFPSPIALVAGRINLKIQEINDKVGVKTRDNAFLTFPVAVQFKVAPDKVKEAFYELENPVEQITSYVLNLVRSKAASMTMDEVYTNKDDINEEVELTLKDQMNKFGYEIVRILVDEPQPSKEVADSFNRVVAAQREQEAAKAEAAALRIKLVGEAEANAESLKLQAQAYVHQRNTLAEGISDAMQQLRDGLQGVSDKEILQYFADIDYRDAIRDASKNPGTLIITPPNHPNANDLSSQIALLGAINKGLKD